MASGARRIVQGNIAQSTLRGRAMSDALARDLNQEQKPEKTVNPGIKASTKKFRGK